MPKNGARPSPSIVAVAVVLLVGSLASLAVSGRLLGSILSVTYGMWEQLLSVLGLGIVLQVGFSFLGVITSIGLLLLREWARKTTIFLSTVPIALVGFALLFFLAATGSRGRGGLAAGYLLVIYGIIFLVLLPFSIWWCLLLTRESVKSQFIK